MRGTAAVIALLLLGCASAPPRDLDAKQSALRAAMNFIEAHETRPLIVVVARRDQFPLARGIRDVALPSDLALGENGTGLPAGYLLLESLVVNGDTAEFRGRVGPITERGMACGTGYTIPMTRSANGEWVITKFTLTVC